MIGKIHHIKDSLDHTGQYTYKYWTGFTVDDIRKQVVIYVLDGISHYPSMEMKLKIPN